jgi:hypothetical protein
MLQDVLARDQFSLRPKHLVVPLSIQILRVFPLRLPRVAKLHLQSRQNMGEVFAVLPYSETNYP